MDDVILDTFTTKLRERVAFQGRIAREAERWAGWQTLAFLAVVNFLAWAALLALVGAVAQARGF